jgi:hypothetical protein
LTETDDANVWLNSAIDGVILASNDLYAPNEGDGLQREDG